jgi:hypothetical protein
MFARWFLVVSPVVLTVACSAVEQPAASGNADMTTGRKVTNVTYSDLGTSLTVRGVSSFFEGESTLFLTNESDALLNTAQDLVGRSGIAAKSVRGDNGMGPFEADFDVSVTGHGGKLLGLRANNRQCIGVYESNGGPTPMSVGAFSSCQEPLDGSQPDCQLKLYPDAATCLADQVRLVSVGYSDDRKVITVKGQASFFEGSIHVFLRNETKPAVNLPVAGFAGDEYESVADKTVEGKNGLQPFEVDLASGETTSEGDCIGVYQDRGGVEGVRSLGAFKFRPTRLGETALPEQRYFFDAAECLSHP